MEHEKPVQKEELQKIVAEPTPSKTPAKNEYIAIVRVRGVTGVRKPTKDTLNMLCLYKHNFCTVRKKTPSMMGMIKKVKDYVTYGELSPEVHAELKKRLKNNKESEPNFIRLNNPKGGYGRKGIKKSFSQGGALAYRGEKINDLLKRML